MRSLVPAPHTPDREGADERRMLLAGAFAMSAFVLLGVGSTAGWLDARLGLIGSLSAALAFLALLARLHRRA